MTQRLPEVSDGRVARSQFGLAADRLNAALGRADVFVRRLGLAARASVELEGEDVRLAFGKFRGRWALHAVDGSGQEFELTTGSVRMRLQAARKLPDLVEALYASRDELIADIEATIRDLDAYCATVDGVGNGEDPDDIEPLE